MVDDAAPDTPQAGTVTVDTMSRLLMLTPERLRQLAKEGHIPRAVKGRYPLGPTVQGYVRYLRDEARRSSKSAAVSRKDDARTREIELRIAERENRLIDIDEHDAVLDEIVALIRSSMAGLPARATRDLAVRREIEKQVDECFRAASARLRERGAQLRASGVTDAAVTPADAG